MAQTSYRLAAWPLLFLAAGCASGVSPAPSEGRASSRIIIRFESATADGEPLGTAIAETCHCRPVFLRQQGRDALIYEVVLPRGLDFGAFSESLLQRAKQFGVNAVEEDRLLRHR